MVGGWGGGGNTVATFIVLAVCGLWVAMVDGECVEIPCVRRTRRDTRLSTQRCLLFVVFGHNWEGICRFLVKTREQRHDTGMGDFTVATSIFFAVGELWEFFMFPHTYICT